MLNNQSVSCHDNIFFVLTLASLTSKLLAQLSVDDSFFYKKSIANTIALYHKTSGNQTALYNGVPYAGYNFGFEKGHPFFYSDVPQNGSIVYDNVLYTDVNLRYDEISKVVLLHQINRQIQLHTEKINSFTISNHQFIHITTNNIAQEELASGFYEILYDGAVTLLKKNTKLLMKI